MAGLKWILLILLLFTSCSGIASAIIGPGDGLNITINQTGNNFILWRWDNSSMDSAPNLTKTIFIDQVKVVDNLSLGYYLATDINPDEEHTIEILAFNVTINSYNNTAFNITKTYEQDVWTLFMIGTGLTVIGWFTAPLLIILAFPVYLLGFGMAIYQTAQSYIILLYGLSTVLSLIIFAIRWLR